MACFHLPAVTCDNCRHLRAPVLPLMPPFDRPDTGPPPIGPDNPPEHDPLTCPCCQNASVVWLAAKRTLDHCDTCGGVLDVMPCLHCEGDDPMCECGGQGMIDCPECEGRRTRLRAALEER